MKKWAEYVKVLVVNDKMDWYDIPGYSLIIKSIFHQMKTREILEYPDSLVDATCALLANEKILQVLIEIIFKKTNVHRTLQVNKTLEI